MVTCPICSSNSFSPFLHLSDYRITKENFELQQCLNCLLVITSNPPSPSKISRYYESENYLEHSNDDSHRFAKIYNQVRQWMFHYKYRILKNLTQHKSVLDIGAASGHFLNFMKNKGYGIRGVEINEKARKYAADHFNIHIDSNDFLEDNSNDQKYGLVTLWHVLEHLYDLDQVVHRIDQLLVKEGAVVIAVPNYNSVDGNQYKKYWAGWDVPRHLWHFSPKSMEILMSKKDFKLIKKKILPFDPFFNCLLSENYLNRNKIFQYIMASFWGILALINGMINKNHASSIVYIFKKNKE